jgi:hypothetical protein
MDWVITELVALAGPAYVFLQLLMAVRYHGRWRFISLLPLVVMVPLAVQAALAYAAGSRAWPVPLILAAPFAFGYLLVLAAVRSAVAELRRSRDRQRGSRRIAPG